MCKRGRAGKMWKEKKKPSRKTSANAGREVKQNQGGGTPILTPGRNSGGYSRAEEERGGQQRKGHAAGKGRSRGQLEVFQKGERSPVHQMGLPIKKNQKDHPQQKGKNLGGKLQRGVLVLFYKTKNKTTTEPGEKVFRGKDGFVFWGGGESRPGGKKKGKVPKEEGCIIHHIRKKTSGWFGNSLIGRFRPAAWSLGDRTKRTGKLWLLPKFHKDKQGAKRTQTPPISIPYPGDEWGCQEISPAKFGLVPKEQMCSPSRKK